ncbi:phosphoribosylamine--glycine ligase [Chitinimonas lacunae]|uniref:Phosphoribosylamine--glycine ligase n=1 Tax=Chitinimonas lacunae TaxID=1963018 RepID=A0ABV8MQM6_9NEIS
MNILVIGGGGREHALAWKLAQSPRAPKVYVAPGNAGTAREENVINLPLTEIPDLIDFVKRENIAFTVVGPEAPLSKGLVDAFRAAGLKVFGPTRAAAQLEWSKDFAKDFMVRHHIPTAHHRTFANADEAHTYVDLRGAPIVIKADGLAAGKGVIVAMTLEEAHNAIDAMLLDNKMGDAGARVVIEDFLQGEEASFIVMVDGKHVLPLASSQDHKRLLDQDQGPNTGGMGAYSPAPVVTPAVHARAMREVILPTVAGMAREGTPFTGFLYAGLMVGDDGAVKVVEFNCRMGDPETQPIMMRLKSDLVELVEHALDGRLDAIEAEWDRRVALGVVVAAGGYPDAPRQGDPITLPRTTGEEVHIFHAGTKMAGNEVVSSGGRVLCVTALGDSVRIAQQHAYQVLENISFAGMQYRSDIGFRAIARKTPAPGDSKK